MGFEKNSRFGHSNERSCDSACDGAKIFGIRFSFFELSIFFRFFGKILTFFEIEISGRNNGDRTENSFVIHVRQLFYLLKIVVLRL